MPSSRYATFLLCLVVMTGTAAPTMARAEALPTRVGTCSETTITFVGGRLEGDTAFHSGTAVLYENGGTQMSYEREEGVIASRIGDRVRLCLASIPRGCPPGDDRGRIYVGTNLRTGATWEMPDSSHMCGGA